MLLFNAMQQPYIIQESLNVKLDRRISFLNPPVPYLIKVGKSLGISM